MSNTLDVTVRREGRVGILETNGYINDTEAEKIVDACQPLIDEGVVHLVLNLAQSNIANSLGISILIEVIEKTRELNGQVGFCHVAPILAKTFQIMGLLNEAKIFDTEAEAVQALGG